MANQVQEASIDLRPLVGAPIALGTESISAVYKIERALVAEIKPVRPSKTELQRIRCAIGDGDDPLGVEFCRIFPSIERRTKGSIYTPRPIIEAMVGWVTDGPRTDRLIDPGS